MKKPSKDIDLMIRMIRVEQNVSKRFGEIVLPEQTKYYNHLSSKEKKQVSSFLRKKTTTKKLFLAFSLFTIVALTVFRSTFTGLVISTNDQVAGSFNFLLVGILGFLLVLFLIKTVREFRSRKTIDSMTNLLVQSEMKR